MEVLFASVPVADLNPAVLWYQRVFGRVPDIVPDEHEGCGASLETAGST